MRKLKIITSLYLLMLMSWTASIQISACELPKEGGSIKVTFTCQGEIVTGGSLTLYRIGDVASNGSEFICTDDFQNSGVNLSDIHDPDIAETLVQYIKTYSIQGSTSEIGKNGEVFYQNQQTGLYLLVQSENSPGYNAIRPFLVSIPLKIGDEYVYNVDATPKMSLTSETETPSDETELVTPSRRPGTDSTLPQTGQLNWPVLVMGILGAVLLLTGLILCYGRKKHEE